MLGPAWRGQPFRDLFLEGQRQALERLRLAEPFEKQGRCDVVGKVRDDLERPARAQICRKGHGIELKGVGLDDLQAPGIGLVEFAEGADAAFVPFDGDDRPGVGRQKRAGEPAWAGTDLDDGDPLEVAGRAGDARGQVQIEQEVLAQSAARGKAMAGDDLAQRGKPLVRVREVRQPTSAPPPRRGGAPAASPS